MKHLLLVWLSSVCSLALIAECGSAATLLLREQATLRGSVVYLGDVADISAASPAERETLVTTPLMAAPPRGTIEYLHAWQLDDLLRAQGLNPAELHIGGTKTVAIGHDAETTAVASAAPSLPERSVEDTEQDLIAAIEAYLAEKSGHADWLVQLSVGEFELKSIGQLGQDVEVRGGRSPWTGSQRFLIASPTSGKTKPILVRVEKLQDTVVAVRNIPKGSLISASDVEMRQQSGNLPSNAIVSISQAIGKEALRDIDPQTVLHAGQLRSPLLVQRGETVKVSARAGGIAVSTYAVAKQAGAMGDLVQLESLNDKQMFAARVAGWKQLEVMASGISTAEFSSPETPVLR